MTVPSDDVVEELETLRLAVEDDRFEDARAALDGLATLFERSEAEATTRVAGIETAVNEGFLSGDEREVAQEYVGTKVATGMTRAGLLAGGEMYLLSPIDTDAREVLDGIDELVDFEGRREEFAVKTDVALSSVTLPAIISVTDVSEQDGAELVGQPAAADVTIANGGDAVASDVELAVQTDLEASPESEDAGDLGPGSERTVTFEFASREGEFRTTFLATSSDAGEDSKQTEISFIGKLELANDAAGLIERLRTLISENGALERGHRTALLASLDRAKSNVDDAIWYMGGDAPDSSDGESPGNSGNGGPPDGTPGRGPPEDRDTAEPSPPPQRGAHNALTTAINQMGAFLNKVVDLRAEEDASPQVEDAFWFTLRRQAEVVIDQPSRVRSVTEDTDGSDQEGTDTEREDDSDDGRGPPEDDGDDGRGPPGDDGDNGRGSPGDEGDDGGSGGGSGGGAGGSGGSDDGGNDDGDRGGKGGSAGGSDGGGEGDDGDRGGRGGRGSNDGKGP